MVHTIFCLFFIYFLCVFQLLLVPFLFYFTPFRTTAYFFPFIGPLTSMVSQSQGNYIIVLHSKWLPLSK